MTDEERDSKITEMHTDIRWIKEWIATQNKYKLMVWGALIGAILALIKG